MSAGKFEAGYDQALWEIRAYAETKGISLASGITAVEAVETVVDMVVADESGML